MKGNLFLTVFGIYMFFSFYLYILVYSVFFIDHKQCQKFLKFSKFLKGDHLAKLIFWFRVSFFFLLIKTDCGIFYKFFYYY